MKKCVITLTTLCIATSGLWAQDTTHTNIATEPVQDVTLSYTKPETLQSTHAGQAHASSVYKIKPKLDIPITAALTAWTLYGFTQTYGKESTPAETISELSRNDIPQFDRWATKYYSEKAADASDLIFYGSMPLPLLLLADKAIRKDAAKIGLLYIQAMSVTGTFYTGSTTFVDRFRPYVYNPNVTEGDQRDGNAKNSFLAGHPALVGTATFFAAKVHADYHPGSKWNKWLFAGAGVATATTGYLRHRGGRHFPSDILAGTTIGVLSGILIPHWHKNKLFKDENLSVFPFSGRSHGLALTYKL